MVTRSLKSMITIKRKKAIAAFAAAIACILSGLSGQDAAPPKDSLTGPPHSVLQASVDNAAAELQLPEDFAFIEIPREVRKGDGFPSRRQSLFGAISRSGGRVTKHWINREHYYVQIALPAGTGASRSAFIERLKADSLVGKVISSTAATLEMRDIASLEIHEASAEIDAKLLRGFRPKKKDFKPDLSRPHKNEILVKYLEADTATEADFAQARDRMGTLHRTVRGTVVRTIRDQDEVIDVVELPTGADLPAALERYQASPQVEFAQPNYIYRTAAVPNDAYYGYGLMWNLPKISAPTAWDMRTDASSVVVAVLDTGIDAAHPDLASNMWTNPNIGGGGYNDGVNGYNVPDNNGNTADGQLHGTHVAGTIGARGNNTQGVTGIAWIAKLMAVKITVGSEDSSTTERIVTGVNYARYKGAKVINLSFGPIANDNALANAITNFGASGGVFVASAGNDGNTHYEDSPLPIKPNVLIVGWSTETDTRDDDSNYGKWSVDLFAPGSSIFSTVPALYGYYSPNWGTSMASPHVAGTVAMVKAHFPQASMRELVDRVRSSVDDIPGLNADCLTGGRLNLAAALGARPILMAGTGRVQVNTGAGIAIGGITISGVLPHTKRVAFRALGPSLGGGSLSNPHLQVFNSGGQLIASNDNYGSLNSTQLSQLASYGLTPSNAMEAAWVADLPIGTYTVHVSGVGGTTGIGTVEAWDLDGSTVDRITNTSTRCYVGTGATAATKGFVVSGPKPRLVGIRVLGQTLTSLGVPGALQDPVMTLYNSSGTPIAASDNYVAEGYNYSMAMRLTNAGMHPGHVSEPVIVKRLNPGSYTVQVTGQSGGTGIALIEVNEF